MNIDEFNYLWNDKKSEFVLVHTEYGYGIVNKIEQTVLNISDEEMEDAVIERMLSEGNKIYNNILDAYDDAYDDV